MKHETLIIWNHDNHVYLYDCSQRPSGLRSWESWHPLGQSCDASLPKAPAGIRWIVDTENRIHWDKQYIYLHKWLVFMVNVGKYTVRPHGSYGGIQHRLRLPFEMSQRFLPLLLEETAWSAVSSRLLRAELGFRSFKKRTSWRDEECWAGTHASQVPW